MDAVPLSAGYELHSPHTFAVLLSILYTATKRVSAKYRSARLSHGNSCRSELIGFLFLLERVETDNVGSSPFRTDLYPIVTLLILYKVPYRGIYRAE